MDFAAFIADVRELDRRRLIQSGYRPNLDVTLVEGRFEDRSAQPDADDLRAFLVDFRLFWATKEPWYLPNVYAAVREAIDDASLLGRLDEAERWHERIEQPQIFHYTDYRPDGSQVVWSRRKLADWWMHGAYLHRSNARKVTWWRTQDPWSRTLIEWDARDYLFAYSGEVFALADIILDAGLVAR